jgi:hypothetical protein
VGSAASQGASGGSAARARSDLDPFGLGALPALAGRGGSPGDAVETDRAAVVTRRPRIGEAAPRSVGVGWLRSATVGGRQARARWSWPACRSVVEACHGVRKAARRRRYGVRGARSDVLWKTAGWREVLPCCTGKPERRLREEVVLFAMPPAAWVTRLASVGGGVVPLVGWSCSSGGMGCPPATPVEAVVVGLRTKILPNLVVADNGGARGRRSPPWGRCRGDSTPVRPSFQGENPNPACRVG